MSKSKKKGGAELPPELPNMPAGNVPQDIRETAEFVVKLEADIEEMIEELKREKEKLVDKMVREECPIVPIIIDRKWKKRIILKKKQGVALKIEDDGMVDEKKPKVTAPAGA